MRDYLKEILEELEDLVPEFGNKSYLFVNDESYTLKQVIKNLKDEGKNEIKDIFLKGINILRGIIDE